MRSLGDIIMKTFIIRNSECRKCRRLAINYLPNSDQTMHKKIQGARAVARLMGFFFQQQLSFFSRKSNAHATESYEPRYQPADL